jgi:hypothetical protein
MFCLSLFDKHWKPKMTRAEAGLQPKTCTLDDACGDGAAPEHHTRDLITRVLNPGFYVYIECRRFYQR